MKIDKNWSSRNLYPGYSCFLICGGPSFVGVDGEFLNQPGILTMALNNAARSFRPQLWTGLDPPEHFIRSVWLDPTILKFTPRQYANHRIFNSDTWQFMDKTVSQCPAVLHFDLAERFDAATFFDHEAFMWGEPDHANPSPPKPLTPGRLESNFLSVAWNQISYQ